MSEEMVYHTTFDQGIETFHPKPYWRTPDDCRSGILLPGTQVPEGAVRCQLFFALGSDKMWQYLSPKDVVKTMFYLSGRGASHDIRRALGLPEDCRPGCVAFDIREKNRLEEAHMSTYEFDAHMFRRMRSGEYVTEKPISPLREIRWTNVIETTRKHSVHVLFVNDIHAFMEESHHGKSGSGMHRVVLHLHPAEDQST